MQTVAIVIYSGEIFQQDFRSVGSTYKQNVSVIEKCGRNVSPMTPSGSPEPGKHAS